MTFEEILKDVNSYKYLKKKQKNDYFFDQDNQ